MPVFDYKCPDCNLVKKDVFVKSQDTLVYCANCETAMRKLFPTSFNAHVWPADGIYLEHVSAKGRVFHSKKEMADFAKRNNLELGALL